MAWTPHTVASTPSPTDAARPQASDESVRAVEPAHVWQAPSSGAPYPGATAGTPEHSSSLTPGAQWPQSFAEGAAQPLGMHVPAASKKPIPVVGVIALSLSVVGVVLACIPAVRVVGGVLLGVGFVASLVSVFLLRGAKWPGIVGMVVGILGGILAVAVGLLTLGSTGSPSTAPPAATSSSPQPSDAPSPEGTATAEAETVVVAELEVGDCLPLVEWEDEVYELPIVPCDQPHTDEVYFVFDAPDSDFPGDAELQTLATEKCDAAFGEFIGVPYADSELDNYWFVPTEASWKRMNDRTIQCIAFSYEEVTGTLEGAAR